MGIDVGPGIEIGPGVIIDSGTSQLREVLSASGKTAYDAATVGNFFNVSSTDYGNVATQLSSVTKYVLNDAQMAATPAGGWTAGFAIAHPAAVATVPGGTYIIGFTCRQGGTSGTVTPLISTAFPPTATYTAIANSPTASSLSQQNYFVRKAPTTATAATSYLGLVQSQTTQLNNTSLSGQQGYYAVAGGPPFSSWTSWTASVLFYQVLGTSTQQW